MKNHISLLLFIFYVCIFTNAQQIDTIYYDRDWNVSNSDNFKYYRLFVEIDDIVKVTDYFKNGKIQMTGGYKSVDFIDQTGPFFYYNKRSQITILELYEPDLYPIILAELNTSGLKIPEVSGLSPILLASYDKNEKIRSIGYGLDNGTAHGTYLYFNKKGNIKGKYNYTLGEIDGEFVLYGSNGKPWLCGNYKNGKRDGPWEYSTPDGNIYKTIIFVDGRKIEKIR